MKAHWSEIAFKSLVVVLMAIIGFLIKFGIDKLDRTIEGMELRIRSLEVGVAPATEDRFTRSDAEKLERDLKEWTNNRFVKK
jgi:hypothetical protein